MIPASSTDIGPRERMFAAEAVASGWLSGGDFVRRLEEQWSYVCHTREAVACCNGTAALHLALLAAGVGPGDAVIVPTLTFAATAAAVVHCGAAPIFVDSDERGCISPPDVAAACDEYGPKAIIAVHLYGHPCAMDAVLAAAGDVPVIEDCAEAHGARYKGRPVGSIGLAGAWSFYGNKIISCGEGGAITTNSAAIAGRARHLRGQAQSIERRFWHTDIGYNYRLNNVSAAIACAQISRLDDLLADRRAVYLRYLDEVGDLIQSHAPWADPVPWLVNVHVPNRDLVAERMLEMGVETRPWFPCVHTMPPYVHYRSLASDTAQRLSESGLSLPTSSIMSMSDVERVCDALREAMK